MATMLATSSTMTQAQNENLKWKNGWVAQSYFAPVGGNIEAPNDYPVDRWLDHGDGLFSTDYMYAFDGHKNYLWNAGTLRSGSIRIDRPGDYRLSLFTDRYYSTGQPACDVKLAIDGSTIINSSTTFSGIEDRIAEGEAAAAAYRYREVSETKSPVFEVSEPGFYRIDFWSFCQDTNAETAIYKLSNELGNRARKNHLIGVLKTEWRLDLGYGSDALVREAVQARQSMSPLKSNIAGNHGTIFDLVLESINTGFKGRITGEDVWHLEKHSPQNDFLSRTTKPMSEIAVSGWEFLGVRGDKAHIYKQTSNDRPIWRQAFQSLPFVPEYMEARKGLKLEEDGIYGISIGFDPNGYRGSNLVQGNKAVMTTGSGSSQQHLEARDENRPVSKPTKIFIERKLEDGSVRRLKIFDDALEGNRFVGEMKFINVRLPAGDYDLVLLRDAAFYEGQLARYGGYDRSNQYFKDDDIHTIRIKKPTGQNYRKIR